MSEGYPQEEWNQIAEKVGPWIDKFFASRQLECLADSHKNEARGVIELFARYSYEYLGAKIRKTGTVPKRRNVAWRNRFTESNVGERGKPGVAPALDEAPGRHFELLDYAAPGPSHALCHRAS